MMGAKKALLGGKLSVLKVTIWVGHFYEDDMTEGTVTQGETSFTGLVGVTRFNDNGCSRSHPRNGKPPRPEASIELIKKSRFWTDPNSNGRKRRRMDNTEAYSGSVRAGGNTAKATVRFVTPLKGARPGLASTPSSATSSSPCPIGRPFGGDDNNQCYETYIGDAGQQYQLIRTLTGHSRECKGVMNLRRDNFVLKGLVLCIGIRCSLGENAKIRTDCQWEACASMAFQT